MKKQIIATFLFFLFAVAVVFADTAIKSEVEKTRISTDDLLTYKVVITSSEKVLPEPQMPKFEGFAVVSQAQSSTFSFVKGEVKNILVYAIILAPLSPGKVKIEPAVIKIKGKSYASEAFEIEVTPGTGRPQPQSNPQPQPKSKPLPKGITQESAGSEVTL